MKPNSNRTRNVSAIIIIAAVGVMLVFWLTNNVNPYSTQAELSPDDLDTPSHDTSQLGEDTVNEPANISENIPVDMPACLDATHFGSDQRLRREHAVLAKLVAGGPDVEALRGLTDVSIKSLIAQGDTAAMVVLARMAEMRAIGETEDIAIRSLVDSEYVQEYHANRTALLHGSITANQQKEFETAATWYYAAALRGRVFALHRYAGVLQLIYSNPAEMGLIPMEEYDALSGEQRAGLQFSTLFMEVALDIAPILRKTQAGIGSRQIEQYVDYTSAIRRDLRKDLVDQFIVDQQAQLIPPISIVESDIVPIDEIMEDYCDPVKNRYGIPIENSEIEASK